MNLAPTDKYPMLYLSRPPDALKSSIRLYVGLSGYDLGGCRDFELNLLVVLAAQVLTNSTQQLQFSMPYTMVMSASACQIGGPIGVNLGDLEGEYGNYREVKTPFTFNFI